MENSLNKSPRILAVALSGIGNLMMQLPTLQTIKKAWPNSYLIVWVAPRGTRTLAESLSFIDQVIEAPIKTGIGGHIKNIRNLRRLHADIGLVLSPGQQIKSAIYLWAAGIPNRIGHTYPFRGNNESNFLLTKSIKENEKLHDVEQNLALLSQLDISPTQVRNYELELAPQHVAKAKEIISKLSLANKPLIGFHAGSAPDFTWKRWTLSNFAVLAKKLEQKYNAHILLFGGPDENEQNQELLKRIGENATSIQENLLTTVALMNQCKLIVSNDSGLMHLAAATNTPVIGLFGPTDEQKTGPRGLRSHVLRAPATTPLYNTEKNYHLGEQSHESMNAITPEMVMKKIEQTLELKIKTTEN